MTVPQPGRHRKPGHPNVKTFTPWRILGLLLVGPVTAIAVATAMYFSPGGSQMFHATVQPGELPVVEYTHAPVVTR